MNRLQASHRRSRWGWRSLLWLVPLLFVLFVVISDLFGWAYLRKPIASVLSSQLGRPVEIKPPFRIHLRRSIPIQAGGFHVAAPDWSKEPHFVDVEGLEANVDWGFLVGRRPVLHRLAVERADIRAERDAEGRASWSMGKEKPAKDDDSDAVLPVIERLSIGQAKISVDDALNELDLQIDARAGQGGEGQGQTADAGQQAPRQAGLVVNGSGTWRKEPVSFALRTKGVQPITEGGVLNDIELTGKLRSTELAFNGSVSDLATLGNIEGKVSAKGRSLGDLTAIPGLALPETPPYELEGDLQRSGSTVKVNVTRAEIGSSSMVAQLEYDSAGATPILRGNLNASRLVLQDLGPSIGASRGNGSRKGAASNNARFLPATEFNLPSLRQMNADVAIDLKQLDLGTKTLRPLQSLNARLLLDKGVLRLQDLKSRVAGGTLTGSIVLDASAEARAPVFDTKLKWNQVELKNWISVGESTLVAGRFSGETLLKGQGNSTAAILGSASGSIKGRIDGGTISHQIVELAGLDLAQALGVFVGGDKELPLSCALVDLTAEKGALRSNLLLFNTPDTIFFVQGGVNLRNERLDLRLVQSPKDWSPMSLRSPITIGGTFSDPAIGVEAAPLALKVLASVILGAVTPLAALLPFIEKNDAADSDGCGPAIELVKKKAAELAPKPPGKDAAAKPREEGTPPQPGRVAGERP